MIRRYVAWVSPVFWTAPIFARLLVWQGAPANAFAWDRIAAAGVLGIAMLLFGVWPSRSQVQHLLQVRKR